MAYHDWIRCNCGYYLSCLQVAPLLAIARELLLERTSGKHPVPKKVKLVWVARHAEEFVVLDETLAQATS